MGGGRAAVFQRGVDEVAHDAVAVHDHPGDLGRDWIAVTAHGWRDQFPPLDGTLPNDESFTRRDLFHLVDQIRSEDKYFNVSLAELSRKLEEDSYVEITWEHETTDDDGVPVFTDLRLNIANRGKRGCAASLKLHRIRIDGIDWLQVFDAPDGTRCSGWHRHDWDAEQRLANKHVPRPDFGEKSLTIDDFLVRMCKEMRILLSANDVGINDYLSWA